VIAGAATAVGFFSLFPTDYRGVSDLGLIAGAGMLIALVLNLTLLPALLALFRSGGFKEAGGFARAAPLDRFLIHRRGWVMAAAAVAAAASLPRCRRLRFDFDPINLENPRSESVQTLFDLMKNPDTTPYTLDVMTRCRRCRGRRSASVHCQKWVRRLDGQFHSRGPGRPSSRSWPTRGICWRRPFRPPRSNPPPAPAKSSTRPPGAPTTPGNSPPAGPRIADWPPRSRGAAARGEGIVPLLEANLAQGIPHRLEDMRLALQASTVALDTIPSELKHGIGSPPTDGIESRFSPRVTRAIRSVLRKFVGSRAARSAQCDRHADPFRSLHRP
jgi:hypothetical protein